MAPFSPLFIFYYYYLSACVCVCAIFRLALFIRAIMVIKSGGDLVVKLASRLQVWSFWLSLLFFENFENFNIFMLAIVNERFNEDYLSLDVVLIEFYQSNRVFYDC